MIKADARTNFKILNESIKPARAFTEIKHMWVDRPTEPAFDPQTDIADVIVETDNGELWSASFVTLPYLESQMKLSMEHAVSIAMPAVQYATLEDSHVLIEDLQPETIEDTIDCLVERGIFESVFSRYSDRGPDKN